MRSKISFRDMAQLINWHSDEVGKEFLQWWGTTVYRHLARTGDTEMQVADDTKVSVFRISDWVTLGYDVDSGEPFYIAQDLDRLTALSYEHRKLHGRQHNVECPCRHIGYCGEVLAVPQTI